MFRKRCGPKSLSTSGSESLRSCRSTVLTLVIAHGNTASSSPRSRAGSKSSGATRSAKYVSRNEKVWSVKCPPAQEHERADPAVFRDDPVVVGQHEGRHGPPQPELRGRVLENLLDQVSVVEARAETPKPVDREVEHSPPSMAPRRSAHLSAVLVVL